uniref:Uncharacterized protein n=1 Tax=Cannabis sativa TaxID=3483 RepID=A0A803NSA8_CANSA
MLQERLILGRFGGKRSDVKRRRPEDRVLKSSQGVFRKGVLDVKHLLSHNPSRATEPSTQMFNKGRKTGNGNNKGKSGGVIFFSTGVRIRFPFPAKLVVRFHGVGGASFPHANRVFRRRFGCSGSIPHSTSYLTILPF